MRKQCDYEGRNKFSISDDIYTCVEVLRNNERKYRKSGEFNFKWAVRCFIFQQKRIGHIEEQK